MKIKSKQNGFSLIEIVVVLAIMGLLAAIVGTNVIGVHYKGQVSKVRVDFNTIKSALKMYKLENGLYPSTAQGIAALVTKTEIDPVPRAFPKEGYLESMPKDPWNNEYKYFSPGENRPYDIVSYGADGVEGGEDEAVDLGVWDEGN